MKPIEIGEIIRFGYEIQSSDPNDTITGVTATWKLFKLSEKQEITYSSENKECTVTDNKKIYALVPFNTVEITAGTYMLEVTAIIPPETKIERQTFEVVE